MRIGGLIKLSLVDYPGKTAAVVFTQGCNFRCPYCHNKDLVLPECFQEPVPEAEVMDYLCKRQGMIGGVVVTGGEPTLQKDLAEFLSKIKSLGYSVKLDTNGHRPDVLKNVIEQKLVDFIAMDVKAPLGRYEALAGVKIDPRLLQESIEIIKNSGLAYQLRTTLVKQLHRPDDLPALAELVKGARCYKLQNFTCRDSVIDPKLNGSSTFSPEELAELREKWEIPCGYVSA